MKTRLKINGIIIVAASLLLVVLPKLFFRADIDNFFDELSEVAGLALIVLGFLWRISARSYKSCYSNQGCALVKSGPYKAVRNPMYLGIVLIGLGVVLMLFNFWASLVFTAVFIIRYVLLIFQEEKKLVKAFGSEYEQYKKSTPRLLPSIKTVFFSDLKYVLPLKASWLKKDTGTFIFVFLVVMAVESWEDIRSEGLFEYSQELLFFGLVLFFFVALGFYLSQGNGEAAKDEAGKSQGNK